MNPLQLTTKIADQSWELEEICRLNHQTFSEEIPQHSKTENGLLIDKFHSENKYVICLHQNELIGMIALRSVRPFSLDFKLENIEEYLPPHQSLCEIRLLVIKPQYRGSMVFFQLYKKAFAEFVKSEYDYAVMSGILLQQKLYRNIGFVPFGPLVGDNVKFQPMYSSPDYTFRSKHKQAALSIRSKIINVLPGPVNIKSIVTEEFKNNPESHRSVRFKDNYLSICKRLCHIVRSKNVQLLTGSGTLSNEVLLAHLSTLPVKGLILSNGEFGNRIIQQAINQKVDFYEYKINSGGIFDINAIKLLLKTNEFGWLYFVHCETSTGVLNDLNNFIKECAKTNTLVVVDCISTFGIIPLDLSNVYMACASSGKAIGSYSGLSMVFFNELQQSIASNIPVYLNIRNYIAKGGIPFTLNSNALYALGTALEISDIPAKFKKVEEAGARIRNKLLSWNIDIGNNHTCNQHPAIITIRLSTRIESSTIGRLLEEKNIFVNYNSDYLSKQNMIQICLFSDIDDEEIELLSKTLKLLIKDS